MYGVDVNVKNKIINYESKLSNTQNIIIIKKNILKLLIFIHSYFYLPRKTIKILYIKIIKKTLVH